MVLSCVNLFDRIETHQFSPDDIPFPALVLCAETAYDEFNVMATALNRVSFWLCYTLVCMSLSPFKLKFRCMAHNSYFYNANPDLAPLEHCNLPEYEAIRKSPFFATFLEDLKAIVNQANSGIGMQFAKRNQI